MSNTEGMSKGQAREYLRSELRNLGIVEVDEESLDSLLELTSDTSFVEVDRLLASIFG